MSDDEDYGIDKVRGHPRAIELIPDEFFWDCSDELGPFGSDEGDTALEEFREWRRNNPRAPVEDCIIWTLESVGEIDASDYSDAIADEATIKAQLADEDFDDQQYIYTVDASVIATGFGQLADEGTIDESAKPYIRRALMRQAVWGRLVKLDGVYIRNLQRLDRALNEA
ncbi:hypothetical protein BWI17_03920 [Betaproteobacteria bacterium GR16-43]|nr:hypothetical protein BWI17_03920 [Betaproteobacteria bacterium GR16-43]